MVFFEMDLISYISFVFSKTVVEGMDVMLKERFWLVMVVDWLMWVQV